MIPWSVIWAFVPKRYLIAAGAALAALCVIWGAIALYGSHREARGYNAGYNHAVVIETQKQVVVVDSLEHVADSAASAAKSQILAAQGKLGRVSDRLASTDAAAKAAPHIDVSAADSIAELIARYPVWVKVTNRATGAGYPVPQPAALDWALEDSVFHRIVEPQLMQARDSIVQVSDSLTKVTSAFDQEKQARTGADSLSALWRTRALNVPPSASHRTRDVAFATLGIVAGFVAARHIR